MLRILLAFIIIIQLEHSSQLAAKEAENSRLGEDLRSLQVCVRLSLQNAGGNHVSPLTKEASIAQHHKYRFVLLTRG